MAAPNDARSVYAHAASTLKALDGEGFAVAILSNESLDRFVNQDALGRKLKSKCARLARWISDNAAHLPANLLVCVALSKKDQRGQFHKSVGDGMWRYARHELLGDVLADGASYDAASSFFVGDSADDRNLAACAGIDFHHVDRFFTEIRPPGSAESTTPAPPPPSTGEDGDKVANAS